MREDPGCECPPGKRLRNQLAALTIECHTTVATRATARPTSGAPGPTTTASANAMRAIPSIGSVSTVSHWTVGRDRARNNACFSRSRSRTRATTVADKREPEEQQPAGATRSRIECHGMPVGSAEEDPRERGRTQAKRPHRGPKGR